MRPAADVVDELEELVRKHGVRTFAFVDGVFNLPENHARQICQGIIARGLDVTWVANITMKGMTLDFLRLLKAAGCTTLMFSPDGLTTKSLKGLKKSISEKEVWKTFFMLVKGREFKDITIFFNFFLNGPGQSVTGILKMFLVKGLAMVLNKKPFGRNIIVSIEWIRIEPGTELYSMVLKDNLISKNKSLLHGTKGEIQDFFYKNKEIAKIDNLIYKARALLKKR